MLVDNAVVVLEAIHREREGGLGPRGKAPIEGTGDVAAAVVASTLTTVAVFLPIAFVEGVAGELFGDLALAVVSSLVASLAVALLVVPMLSARCAGPPALRTTASSSWTALRPGATPRPWPPTLRLHGVARRSCEPRPVADFRASWAWQRERLASRRPRPALDRGAVRLVVDLVVPPGHGSGLPCGW